MKVQIWAKRAGKDLPKRTYRSIEAVKKRFFSDFVDLMAAGWDSVAIIIEKEVLSEKKTKKG